MRAVHVRRAQAAAVRANFGSRFLSGARRQHIVVVACEVQGRAHEDENVPDLVEAEFPGNRVRALRREENPADREGNAAERQECDAAELDALLRGKREEDAEPAEGHIHRHRRPSRKLQAARATSHEADPEQREPPARAEDDPALPTCVEAHQANGRHRPGYQEVDGDVVQLAQQPHEPGTASDAVVAKARPEQKIQRRRVQGEADDGPCICVHRGPCYQRSAAEQREHSAHQVRRGVEDLVCHVR
mmetsp:Transcript_71709/g.201178  ORF Transcript_71709/g.201178 Transcript_71709/m.201178 type:complete len:246 (+) Transcript_71709:22-759(+)